MNARRRGPLILFVDKDSAFFASHRLPLASLLLRAGARVILSAEDSGRVAEIESEGIGFHRRLPVGRMTSLSAGVALSGKLAREYNRVRPDVIHHITLRPIVFGSLASLRFRSAIVVNAFTGLGVAFQGAGLGDRIRRWSLSLAIRLLARLTRSSMIFQNQDDFDEICGTDRELRAASSIVYGSGVPLDSHPVLPPTDNVEPTFAFLGRFLKSKGLPSFFEAAALLRSQGYRARFVVAGRPQQDNPDSLDVRSVMQACEISGVEYLGFQERVQDLLRSIDVVCLPTAYREGVPRIILEAAACGRASIVSSQNGLRWAVAAGVSGIVIDEVTTPALVAAMTTYCNNPQLIRDHGREARRIAEERFGIDKVAQEVLSLYRRRGIAI